MRFGGGGLVLLVIIALAVHVIRTGRPIYWIFLFVFVPPIGIPVYFLVELLPEFVGGYRGRRAAGALGRAIDPGRGYRRLSEAVEAAPTVQNMLNLAEECLALGRFDEAVELYRRCLQGVHSDDPPLLYGLAQALFGTGDYAGAKSTLEDLNAIPGYESPDAHLLYARSLEALGETAEARHEYEAVTKYYPGPEASCRYALMLEKLGEYEAAAAIFGDVWLNLRRSPHHVRRRYREWYMMARSRARR